MGISRKIFGDQIFHVNSMVVFLVFFLSLDRLVLVTEWSDRIESDGQWSDMLAHNASQALLYTAYKCFAISEL